MEEGKERHCANGPEERHSFGGLMRTATQEFPQESFFNALQWGLDANEDEEDFFITHTLHTFVIPRAVLHFTGEALEAEQDTMIRECNNPVYDRMIQENWVTAVYGAKGQNRNSQAEVNDC